MIYPPVPDLPAALAHPDHSWREPALLSAILKQQYEMRIVLDRILATLTAILEEDPLS